MSNGGLASDNEGVNMNTVSVEYCFLTGRWWRTRLQLV